MNNTINKHILDEMIEKDLVKKWTEKITETKVVTASVSTAQPESQDDIAVSSDGITYSKKAVFDYLMEKGYEINQTNIDLVARLIGNGGEYVSEEYRIEEHNILEDTDDNDILNYINFKILEEINNIKKHLTATNYVEYAVEVIRDSVSGGTDIISLRKVLEAYSREGWKLKTSFTNELGRNSTSIGGIGVNSTVDQTILIFERNRQS